jgi:hypothetical protein
MGDGHHYIRCSKVVPGSPAFRLKTTRRAGRQGDRCNHITCSKVVPGNVAAQVTCATAGATLSPYTTSAAAELLPPSVVCYHLFPTPGMSPHSTSHTCSWLWPAPEDTRGWRDRTVANMSYVSFWSHVMSAFSCSPKISGLGTIG